MNEVYQQRSVIFEEYLPLLEKYTNENKNFENKMTTLKMLGERLN
jgi:hypothetical protein